MFFIQRHRFSKNKIISIIIFLVLNNALASNAFANNPHYLAWKNETQERWKNENKTLTMQVVELLSPISDYFTNTGFAATIQYYIGKLTGRCLALYAYNLLRELTNTPTVTSVDKIDQQWLSEVVTALKAFLVMEKKGREQATLTDKELLAEAKSITDYQGDINLFTSPEGASTRLIDLTLCQNRDLDRKLFTLYHELAHVVHKDTQRYDAAKSITDYERYLNQKEVTFDISAITHYINLAKKTIDNSSILGRYMRNIIDQNPPYWISPAVRELYVKTLFVRTQELRADLFALRQLYKQHKISPIVKFLTDLGSSQYITAILDEDEHPSSFERALYTAGFLIDQKVDINKLFRDWENKGVCVDAINVIKPWTFTLTKPVSGGAYDFLRAYEAWQQQNRQEDYKIWKDNKQQNAETNKRTINLLKLDLLTEINVNKESLQEAPTSWHYQRKILFAYNYLRELYKLPPAASIDEIDKQWLTKQNSILWKKYFEPAISDATSAAVGQNVIKLRNWIKEYTKCPHADPEHYVLESYNTIAQELGKKTISNVKEIDFILLEQLIGRSYAAKLKKTTSNF